MRTLLCGDFNFLEAEVYGALQRTGGGEVSAVMTHYPTNIQPQGADIPPEFGGGPLAPKRIDHVLQLGGLQQRNHVCGVLPPDEVLPGLQCVVNVMVNGCKSPHDGAHVVPVWEQHMTQEECTAFFADSTVREDKPPPRTAAVYSDIAGAGSLSKIEQHPSAKWNGGVRFTRTTSELVAGQAKVSRELARVALNRPEVAVSPSPETAAVEWLLHEDVGRVGELLKKESSPLTSPGPFRQSPWSSPVGSPGTSPSISPSRPPPLNVDNQSEKVKRQFAMDISSPIMRPK